MQQGVYHLGALPCGAPMGTTCVTLRCCLQASDRRIQSPTWRAAHCHVLHTACCKCSNVTANDQHHMDACLQLSAHNLASATTTLPESSYMHMCLRQALPTTAAALQLLTSLCRMHVPTQHACICPVGLRLDTCLACCPGATRCIHKYTHTCHCTQQAACHVALPEVHMRMATWELVWPQP